MTFLNKIAKDPIRNFVRILRRGIPLGRREVDLPVEHIGSDGYGNYAVCPTFINPDSIVYSCGIGEDISFDLGMIARFGAKIHAFDPTPRSIQWLGKQSLPAGFTAYPYAVGAEDGRVKLFVPKNSSHISHSLVVHDGTTRESIEAPMFRLSTLLKQLGHTRIDVLKLDIEGAEYDVLADIARQRIPVKQIAVEFHHNFRSIGKARTRSAIQALKDAGFSILDVNPHGTIFTFIA